MRRCFLVIAFASVNAVTPILLSPQSPGSAPATDRANALLHRARDARLRRDSALASYEATARQRVSMSIGVRVIGRQRVAYRHEDAARIHWRRNAQTRIELLGSRSYLGAFHGNFGSATDRDLADFVPLPYFPGRDRLWSGDGLITDFVGQSGTVKDSVNTRELVNPLATGAEQFYEYEIGDSIGITLPGNRRITLVELRVSARRPRWNLVVGSFWFDAESADLVRAAYRLSAPTDISAAARERGDKNGPPRWLSAIIGRLQYEITAISVEYSLVNERFWLPRAQSVVGAAIAGAARATMQIDQRFEYASALGMQDVNKQIASGEAGSGYVADSNRAPVASGNVPRTGAVGRAQPCGSDGSRTVQSKRYGGSVSVATTVPCDRAKLASAPELSKSIFDEGDEAFSSAAQRELQNALTLRLQSLWSPQSPTFELGLPLTRYNRIEGLSTGLGIHTLLGRGYDMRALVRGSLADREANGEVSLLRSNGRKSIGIAVYRRLDVSSDWGAPLSLGASASALLFGHDEGAYYRTRGVEIVGMHATSTSINWRLFAEQQRKANVRTWWNVFGDSARTLANPVAERITEFGGALRVRNQFNANPDRFHAQTDVRVEGAVGDLDYARLLVEATIGRKLAGPLHGSLTSAVGVTAGTAPIQRQFLLGGVHTIRGERALTSRGTALWMTRSEIGMNLWQVRPGVFADIGWTGKQEDWQSPGRPLSGAGIGLSAFDGLARVDVARGVFPQKKWRVDLTLDARF